MLSPLTAQRRLFTLILMSPSTLQGKVLWITGASSGIGEALAREAARRGALLILSGRNTEALGRLASEMDQGQAASLPFDLADSGQRSQAASLAPSFFGRVDCLVLNAGVSQRSFFTETSPEVFDLIMETNFRAHVDLTRAILPEMLARGSGCIVCVSSLSGLMGAPLRTAYSASKHALAGFFSSLRAELQGSGAAPKGAVRRSGAVQAGAAPKGVQITMVFPGFVCTDISRNALEADGRKHGTLDPLQQNGQDPAMTARIILDGVEAGKLEIKVAFDAKAKLGLFLSRHFPVLFTKTIARQGGL